MLVLNSLFPVIVLIVLGFFLKRFGFTNSTFLGISDRLVYYILFPVMLFWKIGGSAHGSGIAWDLLAAALFALSFMFLVSFTCIRLFRISDFRAGSFAQSCYRFNTYIGMAIVLNSFGEEGVRHFGLVISVAIPLINVFAVTTLIWYSQEKMAQVKRLRLLLRALLSNPLILGCVAGILYSGTFQGFPAFIDNSLRLIAMPALPLALLSIGSSLSFAGIHQHLSLSMLAAFAKLLLFPVLGYFCLGLFGVEGVPHKVGMLFFALPTSTAIYVLSSQMHSDTELASTAIVISTILSFPVLTLVLLL